MLAEFQAALVDLLADAMPIPVYGHVPQDTAAPYIVVGEISFAGDDTDDATRGVAIATVRVIERAASVAQHNIYIYAVRTALHHAELTLAGAHLVSMWVDSIAAATLGDDGRTRESVLSVSAGIADVSTS